MIQSTKAERLDILKRIRDWLFRIGYGAIGIVITILALVFSDLVRIEPRWVVIMTFIILLVPLTQYVIFTKHPTTLKDFADILAKLTLKEFLLLAMIEETVFRLVLLYYVLLPQTGELTAIFLSSITFGVYHFDRYFLFSTYSKKLQIVVALATIAATFMLGLMLAWVFMRLIALSIFVAFVTASSLHGIYNFAVLLVYNRRKKRSGGKIKSSDLVQILERILINRLYLLRPDYQ